MLLLSVILAALSVVAAKSKTPFAECQAPKEQGHQFEGCPRGTIYVSQTDPQSQYGTINGALSSLPNDNSSQVILIGSGYYHEVINVTRPGPLTLLGMTDDPRKLSHNQVNIWNSSFINQTTQTAGMDNADASVFTVSPNRAATLVGTGPLGAPLQPKFGNVAFRAYNLNVSNRATVNGFEIKDQTGPAAALMVAYANASFYECSFASYQDTVFIGRNGSAYFEGGILKGGTDYLYGFGTLWVSRTILASRGSGGGITAWKGSTQWFGDDTFGVYVNDANIVRADDTLSSVDLTRSVSLGRPWNNQSRVIYKNTYMSDIVLPAGFTAWSATDPRIFPNITYYAEAGSFGPGWAPNARNKTIETILTKSKAKEWSIKRVFGTSKPAWIDWETVAAL